MGNSKKSKTNISGIILDYETDNGRRGFGDIIISTPIIQALSAKYYSRVDIVLRKEAQPFLSDNPYIKNIYITAEGLNPDLHLIMGWKLESHANPRNNQERIDAMSELFGVRPVNKHPQLYYPEVEKLPNSIGVSIESTNPVREWNYDNLLELINKFPKFDWYVFGQRKVELPANIHNHLGKLTLVELIQQVHQMERFITVDSLFSHLTAAFDIPTITMYTEVPKGWRCSYYPKTIGLQAHVDCSPCWERQKPDLKDRINECYQRQNSGQSIKCVNSFTPGLIEKAIHDYLL